MNHEIIQPCEALRDFVSHFWACSTNNLSPATPAYYSTANTNTEIAFGFAPAKNGIPHPLFSSILGHTQSFGCFPLDSAVEMFGVSLYSHAVPCFFNVSPAELANQFVEINNLLQRRGQIINEKIAGATSTKERVKIFTQYFLSQLAKRSYEDSTIINAIKHIRKNSGRVDVKEMASAFCLSQKQFTRRFSEYSGFTPKLYSRIIRFETALWHSAKYETYTEVAHAHGYTDQSHFINEFKEFAGYSPNKFSALVGY